MNFEVKNTELLNISKKYSAVFVGPVRNCGPFLKDVLENIERMGSLFKSYTCVFVESDSTDNSLELLKEYAEGKNNVNVISLGNIAPQIPSRTQRIAAARNVGIEFCEKNGLLDNHDFYIQMCVDNVNADKIDLDGVLSCFKYDINQWDCMTANQKSNYYDIWTLRCKDWIDYDCWWEVDFNRPWYMSREQSVNLHVSSRAIYLPKELGLIEVDSAHGGLSIYKSYIARGCRYFGVHPSRKAEESDIMSFCRGVRVKGGRIFINSEMINLQN
jgi:glycosyltransferase involved in cell wall biosynthesis